MLSDFTKKWKLMKRLWEWWCQLLECVHAVQSKCHMWHITGYFGILHSFPKMKCAYYAFITEISSLFTLECEEHIFLTESPESSKCKQQYTIFVKMSKTYTAGQTLYSVLIYILS